MLKVGDKFTLCALCLKAITLEQAEIDRVMGTACTKKGHAMVIATCTHAPKEKENS
jgi:hypothetical protein